MNFKEKMSKLKAVEDKLVDRLEEAVKIELYDEADKIAFLLLKIRKFETLINKG